jgi:hypothetical protein
MSVAGTQSGFGDYMVFVDESGDHGLQSIDPTYPVFVLAFCVISKGTYARQVIPAVTEFKFKHFGHDQVVLHERDMRKDIGEFSWLKDRAKKDQFMAELTVIIDQVDMVVVAVVVRKDHLADRYAYPNNPYELALGLGMERVHKWLARYQQGQLATTVVLECRGKREDEALELEFRRICAGKNYEEASYSFEPRFVPKTANVPGLQLADLMARPIGLHVMRPTQANRAWVVIETKLDRNPTGDITGWGLKVFP